MGVEGLEPSTLRLSGVYSSPLSYMPLTHLESNLILNLRNPFCDEMQAKKPRVGSARTRTRTGL